VSVQKLQARRCLAVWTAGQSAAATSNRAGHGRVDWSVVSRCDRLALASIAAGAVLRVVWGLVLHPPSEFIFSDMAIYVAGARRLAEGVELGRYDAFRPPGTSLLLAFPMKLLGTGPAGLWGGAVLWCLLSSLTPLFMWRLARLLLTPTAAALTAFFCAVWPLFISYGAFFSSETPLTALLTGALWLAYRAQQASGRARLPLGLLAGLLAGGAVVTRPQALLNVLVVAVPLLVSFRRQRLVLAGITTGMGLLILGVVWHNTSAAGKLTGISENGGVTFFLGHCDVHRVYTFNPVTQRQTWIASPVAVQLRRGRVYRIEDHFQWDQSFFYQQGLACIRRNGLGHLSIVARNVLDMGATTVPWPQSRGDELERVMVSANNLIYSFLLPFVAVGSILLIRRRGAQGWRSGEAVLITHLSCVLLLAALVFGDPRFRTVYDGFGLGLLAALIANRFGLDGAGPGEGEGAPAASSYATRDGTGERGVRLCRVAELSAWRR
jgi:4-amino-4-deoxy-L-arabinose transferase-like glycosyltransferase